MITGIHHVTAIAGDPQANVDFYAGTLGLRLVKQTINYDDPGTYHLYYGDGLGRPGTILTFFPWANARRGRVGPLQIAGAPGRNEPDLGEIHYPYLFQVLEEIGYVGWIGCEYNPRLGAQPGGTSAGLGWLKKLPGLGR